MSSATVGIPMPLDDSAVDFNTNGVANLITGFPSAILGTENEIMNEDGVADMLKEDIHDFRSAVVKSFLDIFDTKDSTLKIWEWIYLFYTDMYYQLSFVVMMPVNLLLFSFAIGNWRMD